MLTEGEDGVGSAAPRVHGGSCRHSALARLLQRLHGGGHAGDVHLSESGNLDALCVLSYVNNGVLLPRFIRQKVEQLLVIELHEGDPDTEVLVLLLQDELEDVPYRARDHAVQGGVIVSTGEIIFIYLFIYIYI